LGFCSAKLGQIDPNFLHVVLQRIISNFHFWVNLSYSTKFGEREMPTSMLPELGLKKWLSAEISPKTALWALFEHVPHIFMT
jgi:hypothetical protein